MRLNTPIQVTQEFMLKCNIEGMNLLNGVYCYSIQSIASWMIKRQLHPPLPAAQRWRCSRVTMVWKK